MRIIAGERCAGSWSLGRAGRITRRSAAVDAWFDEVKKGRWTSTASVKKLYATASVVNASGSCSTSGKRLPTRRRRGLREGIVWIKWIGTHADYDRIDVRRYSMNAVKPIRTRRDYESAMKAIERLWGARAGTPEGDRLDVLATLIALSRPSTTQWIHRSIEAIKFRWSRRGSRGRILQILDRTE